MSDPERKSKSGLPPKVSWLLAIVFLVLLAYQGFNGVVFKKIGFGPFSIELGTPAPRPSETPVATRDFLIGRWQNDSGSGVFLTEYFVDGSCSLWWNGYSDKSSAHWEFTPLDNYHFRLRLTIGQDSHIQIAPGIAPQIGGQGTKFGIQDHNHIHSVEEDQLWTRVPQ